MTDMPHTSAAHTPATMTTAAFSWLVAALSPRRDRKAAHEESQESPRDRERRLEAAIHRREELRSAVRALLR
ncbi:hypothetical protein [Pararhodobacter sp. SW119]|uniref:hypothetical protein n=1 Tax=Pararhodobacter sp. SW119 TaxID=2780075 RepID=UPI001ADF25E0|nr:hypothetical protein [Pararhodobacter sp. SW119]